MVTIVGVAYLRYATYLYRNYVRELDISCLGGKYRRVLAKTKYKLKNEREGATQELSLPHACLVCGRPVLGCLFEDSCQQSLLCEVHFYASQGSDLVTDYELGPIEVEVRRERERLSEWRPVVDAWYQRMGLHPELA
jgi:hypothetical protein